MTPSSVETAPGNVAPLVSLHITAFNSERYLELAAKSVLRQTLGNFELILWNDGSTDKTAEIMERVAGTDGRVRVFHSENLGIAKAHEKAILASRGNYIGWVDSDDLLAPTALAETVAALDQNPKAGLAYTQYFDMSETGRQFRLGKRCQIPYSSQRMLVDFMTFHFRLLRREAFDAVGGMDVANQCGAEDYDLCLRMAERYPVVLVPQPLYYYRVHTGSYSNQHRFDQITASEQAVRRAMARRGIAETHELSVNITAQFTMRKKGSPNALGAVEKKPVREIKGASVNAQPPQKKLNVVAGKSRRGILLSKEPSKPRT